MGDMVELSTFKAVGAAAHADAIVMQASQDPLVAGSRFAQDLIHEHEAGDSQAAADIEFIRKIMLRAAKRAR